MLSYYLVFIIITLFIIVRGRNTLVIAQHLVQVCLGGQIVVDGLAVCQFGLSKLHLTVVQFQDGTLTYLIALAGYLTALLGLLNGLILGIIAFAGVGFYIVLAKHYPLSQAFLVSGCIGASLILAMFISSMVGTVVPMFFKKIGVDPAVASGPLITTITDLVGVVSYYSLAWIMLDRFTSM